MSQGCHDCILRVEEQGQFCTVLHSTAIYCTICVTAARRHRIGPWRLTTVSTVIVAVGAPFFVPQCLSCLGLGHLAILVRDIPLFRVDIIMQNAANTNT